MIKRKNSFVISIGGGGITSNGWEGVYLRLQYPEDRQGAEMGYTFVF